MLSNPLGTEVLTLKIPIIPSISVIIPVIIPIIPSIIPIIPSILVIIPVIIPSIPIKLPTILTAQCFLDRSTNPWERGTNYQHPNSVPDQMCFLTLGTEVLTLIIIYQSYHQ